MLPYSEILALLEYGGWDLTLALAFLQFMQAFLVTDSGTRRRLE
jgi:hypothetical protein